MPCNETIPENSIFNQEIHSKRNNMEPLIGGELTKFKSIVPLILVCDPPMYKEG